MTQDDVIEMAQQAHFNSKTWIDIYNDGITTGEVRGYLQSFAQLVAAKALRENAMREVQRLGQEIEQEPVAWVSEDVCKGQYIDGRPRKIWWECEKGVGTAFYTTPPQQEPVALESLLGAIARGWCHEKNANKEMDSDLAMAIATEVKTLYATPPQLEERNFCQRCGKRTKEIHTCTLPQDNT